MSAVAAVDFRPSFSRVALKRAERQLEVTNFEVPVKSRFDLRSAERNVAPAKVTRRSVLQRRDSATYAQNDASVSLNDGWGTQPNGSSALNDGWGAQTVDDEPWFRQAQPTMDSATSPRMTDELSRVTVVGRVGNIIVTTLMILVLGLAAVVVVIPRAMGATNLTVLTGSMQPAINPGDLVVVRPTPAENLAVGDIITFQPYSGNPMLITHRITSMTFEAGVVTGIVTQGDANNAADRMIQPAQVMGRVIYTIPWLGHLTTGTGVFIIFGAIGASLVGYSIFTIFRKEPQASPATAASSDTPVEAL